MSSLQLHSYGAEAGTSTEALVPVVLVELGKALLVARVDAVDEPPAHQHFRTVLDEASLTLQF